MTATVRVALDAQTIIVGDGGALSICTIGAHLIVEPRAGLTPVQRLRHTGELLRAVTAMHAAALAAAEGVAA